MKYGRDLEVGQRGHAARAHASVTTTMMTVNGGSERDETGRHVIATADTVPH